MSDVDHGEREGRVQAAQVTHADVLETAMEHLGAVFDASPEGIYVWVDETHKACNEELAALFGRTVEDWCGVAEFLTSFVAEQDRERYATNYHTNVRGLQRPVTFRFRGLREDGETFAAETDMIPLTFLGHPVAYHFVREVEK